jgi:hypothetical protein
MAASGTRTDTALAKTELHSFDGGSMLAVQESSHSAIRSRPDWFVRHAVELLDQVRRRRRFCISDRPTSIEPPRNERCG